jgi:hypothetical protein
MDRREQLEIWIAATRRNQRRIAVAVAVLAVLSIAAGMYRGSWGTIGFVITVSFAVVGFWVTSSHLADWNHQLGLLRQQRKNRA